MVAGLVMSAKRAPVRTMAISDDMQVYARETA
jgi:hypothetical protein